MNRKITLVVAFALLGAGYASTQTATAADKQVKSHSAMPMAKGSAATKKYEAVMAKMMKSMMMSMTGKPDLDFVNGMMPHHQGAIDMAKVDLQYGKSLEIQKLAANIIKSQEGEIAFMKKWLAKADQAALGVVPDSAKANEQAMSLMMKDMAMSYSGNADVDFVKGMIPHHQGAIDMAKAEQQYGKDPSLLKLAGDIVSAQEREIAFMNDWLKKNAK